MTKPNQGPQWDAMSGEEFRAMLRVDRVGATRSIFDMLAYEWHELGGARKVAAQLLEWRFADRNDNVGPESPYVAYDVDHKDNPVDPVKLACIWPPTALGAELHTLWCDGAIRMPWGVNQDDDVAIANYFVAEFSRPAKREDTRYSDPYTAVDSVNAAPPPAAAEESRDPREWHNWYGVQPDKVPTNGTLADEVETTEVFSHLRDIVLRLVNNACRACGMPVGDGLSEAHAEVVDACIDSFDAKVRAHYKMSAQAAHRAERVAKRERIEALRDEFAASEAAMGKIREEIHRLEAELLASAKT